MVELVDTLVLETSISEFESRLGYQCGCDGIGIHIGLKIRVMRVRIPPSVPNNSPWSNGLRQRSSKASDGGSNPSGEANFSYVNLMT